MRVLINALFLLPGRVGGSETYVRGLIRGLGHVDQRNEYWLCVGPEAAPTLAPPSDRWRLVVSPTRSMQRPVRLLMEQTWLPSMASRIRADVIHSMGYTGPLASRAKRVTTIHDMNYKRHPEDLTLPERLVYSVLIPLVARTSRLVITDTDNAREDILRWTPARGDRVRTIHLGAGNEWPGDACDDDTRVAAARVRAPFVLTVAASYPHKNLGRLLDAWPLHDADGTRVQLVVVGLKGAGDSAVREQAARLGDAVAILGWVSDELLGRLYRRARALAFPSLYEGFGLPILEAMAVGTPVVTSNFGAMAEVAGAAAELVDPFSVESIRSGLMRVLHHPARAEQLRGLGQERAAAFSWDATARETIAAYEASVSSS